MIAAILFVIIGGWKKLSTVLHHIAGYHYNIGWRRNTGQTFGGTAAEEVYIS